MILSEFRAKLLTMNNVTFVKSDGTYVPSHFHITEIGQITKQFIDCGGTIRSEKNISIQLWENVDVWHRINPSKLISIIDISRDKLNLEDLTVEVEYQTETISKYGVEFADGAFVLTSTHTACLASDVCGIPVSKIIEKVANSCCSKVGECC